MKAKRNITGLATLTRAMASAPRSWETSIPSTNSFKEIAMLLKIVGSRNCENFLFRMKPLLSDLLICTHHITAVAWFRRLDQESLDIQEQLRTTLSI